MEENVEETADARNGRVMARGRRAWRGEGTTKKGRATAQKDTGGGGTVAVPA